MPFHCKKQAAAVTLGGAIPALVYASLVVGFYMWSMAGREA